MVNSFLDDSKSAIESTAVASATGLTLPSNDLLYPPASIEDIPVVTRLIFEGGHLEQKGMVEKYRMTFAWGVWVTVEAETDYIKNCFEEYKAHTNPNGRYFTLL